MTDQEICVAAMTEWPAEARPKDIEWSERSRTFRLSHDGFESSPRLHVAIALFESSGLKWLVDKSKWALHVAPPDDEENRGYTVGWPIDFDQAKQGRWKSLGEGPTLLSAIHAAILSATHESKEK